MIEDSLCLLHGLWRNQYGKTTHRAIALAGLAAPAEFELGLRRRRPGRRRESALYERFCRAFSAQPARRRPVWAARGKGADG